MLINSAVHSKMTMSSLLMHTLFTVITLLLQFVLNYLQEKYLSEPYSEEPYNPDETSKLLAFGEDYDQFLDHEDSECSSVLSGFEPNARKRRPLMVCN